jgi:hypothetical protein
VGFQLLISRKQIFQSSAKNQPIKIIKGSAVQHFGAQGLKAKGCTINPSRALSVCFAHVFYTMVDFRISSGKLLLWSDLNQKKRIRGGG